jgi:hypothetical protein
MAWTLVPCLVSLRAEFNTVSPTRDKGADGSIGDSAHTSSSDHTPDEGSDVLRDHDADDKNEVHALDIDSTGPWPESFDAIIKRLVAREKAEYESATIVGRLQYVIWNRRIASRSWGWTWHDYTLADPHINHAHFSARYTTEQEADTRPWGVAPRAADDKEPDVPLATDKVKLTKGAADALGPAYKEGQEVTGETALNLMLIHAARASKGAAGALAAVVGLAAKDTVDEAAIAAALAPAVAELVLAGLPAGADQISQDEVNTAVANAFRDAFAS